MQLRLHRGIHIQLMSHIEEYTYSSGRTKRNAHTAKVAHRGIHIQLRSHRGIHIQLRSHIEEYIYSSGHTVEYTCSSGHT